LAAVRGGSSDFPRQHLWQGDILEQLIGLLMKNG
jgi:hypothetical protein